MKKEKKKLKKKKKSSQMLIKVKICNKQTTSLLRLTSSIKKMSCFRKSKMTSTSKLKKKKMAVTLKKLRTS